MKEQVRIDFGWCELLEVRRHVVLVKKPEDNQIAWFPKASVQGWRLN